MKSKLNCILLIDDDEPTNFINQMVVKKSGLAEKCITKTSGQAALDYLLSTENGEFPQPDLIFLDINMPGMNGWEFLVEYNQLGKEKQGKIVVVMLTTSMNPDDRAKAVGIELIADFRHKPLSLEMLQEIVNNHFAGFSV